MDTSHFDNDIAAAVSDATAKRDDALGEIGEAVLDQIRRMAGQAVESPQLIVFHGLGETGHSRALDGIEILSLEGNTYVETFDEQRDLWQVALACWDLVAELIEAKSSMHHTFTVDLDSGMVHTETASMSLHDPAAFVTLDGQLVRN